MNSRLLRRLLQEQGILLVLVWAGFVVVVTVVGAVIDNTAGLDNSIWEQAAQVGRWFAAFIGVYLTGTVLRLAVAHGLTRREFLVQGGLFVVVYSAGFALLITLTFGIETLLYRAFDLPQSLIEEHFYSSPTQYGRIFLTFWITIAAWQAASALIAAAFTRNTLLGFASIPLGVLLVSPTELLAGYATVPVLLAIDAPPTVLTLTLCLAALAGAATANWALIRHMPIRPSKGT